MSDQHSARTFRFDRWFNVRDLDGLPSAAGTTAKGRLYRSAKPGRLSAEDEPRARALGLRTVIDLRRDDEQRPSHPLVQLGAEHRRANLLVGDPTDAGVDVTSERYLQTLERGRESFRQVFTWLGEEAVYPAVVHCADGTHRTALVVGLALDVLGVPHEEIETDYQMSRPETERLMQSWAARGWCKDASPNELERAVGVYPGMVTDFLAAVRERYGGSEAYLLGAGVPADAIAGFRRAMAA